MNLLYVVESGDYKYLVFDEMPDKISTKYGDDTIIGRIGGIFYDFLAKRNERREAFGGRKFDVVLDNGEVEDCQSDWFIIDKEIFMQPENKNKAFILGTRKTGCDMIVLGGTNCSGSNMDWLFGCLDNENFYVCQPLSFYKSQQEIQKVNPLYAFKVATAYFREQGKVPVFEDSNCRLIKL